MKVVQGKISGEGKRFAIVVSRWNELVTKELLDGALSELEKCGVTELEVFHVPGTWEIPPVVSALSRREKGRPDAIIALGCILQGQTPHAALLAGDVAGALMNVQATAGIPVAWGILTPDTQDQALDRAGLKFGNKGREAALAALETASVLEQV
ncbi:MAG: 6,7-dimethyl-8-ribityllumazine synthase [Armatimonadetes bacterium 55-13]|nr:6,7-dimethyl-8-ribityllumazine synthase [Armatimonadota bacterium]OJU62720.1 MAG: 6,7-dimethyl-8-ribityllumazine synthase [Armatimonadetes bacterium 55-13]